MASLQFQLLGLLGVLSLLSTLSTVEGIEMYTIPKVLATCGQNVTLRCNVTGAAATTIQEFNWTESKGICNWGQPSTNPDIVCRNTTSATSFNYSMIFYNVQPKHKGTYHCKLRTKDGVKNGQTILRVQKCVGNTTVEVSSTNGTCVFDDVFPKPAAVSWALGNDEIVQSLATTNVTEKANGLFTAVSSIKLRKDPTQYKYNCSLMVPTENEMNETVIVAVRSMTFNGGNSIIMNWSILMLAMVLGMVMVQA